MFLPFTIVELPDKQRCLLLDRRTETIILQRFNFSAAFWIATE
jgi:hypothetical protein